MTRLTSERLSMRPFELGDADELHRLFTDSDVRRYLLDDAVVPREWVIEEIAESERRFRDSGAGLWTIRVGSDPRVVGFVGFRPFFDPPRLQLLYGLVPEVWGRGLARETAARVCRHAFADLGFDEVEAATDVPNERSAGVLRALGFSLVEETDDGEAGTLFWTLDAPGRG